MKKINKRRLNNKGFTLIELLAVIVILAVVMGIATNSVLTSMNNARGGSLIDSAEIVKRDMSNRLMSAQLNNTTGGAIAGTSLVVGTSGASYITKSFVKEFGLSDTDYNFIADNGTLAIGATADVTATNSFVYYNATDNSFVVCLSAKAGGKYDVSGFRKSAVSLVSHASGKYIKSAAVMFGCTNGTKTW